MGALALSLVEERTHGIGIRLPRTRNLITVDTFDWPDSASAPTHLPNSPCPYRSTNVGCWRCPGPLVHRSCHLYPAFGSVHTFGDVGIFHVLAVPGEADIAFSIDDDQAACAGGFGSEKGNCCCGGIAGYFSMSYEVGGAFGYQQTHEIFTIACAGNGGVVVRIEATAYEG